MLFCVYRTEIQISFAPNKALYSFLEGIAVFSSFFFFFLNRVFHLIHLVISLQG